MNDQVEDIIENITDEQEELLREEHAKDFIGFDDDMEEDFNDWLMDLTLEEFQEILDL